MATGFIGAAVAQPAHLPENPLPGGSSHAVNQVSAEKAARAPEKKLYKKSEQAHKSLKSKKKQGKKHKKDTQLPKDCCD